MTVTPAPGNTRPLEIGDDLAPIAVRDGHTDYPTARATFVATGSPDVVLRATTPEHVAAGVRLAVDTGRPLSIRQRWMLSPVSAKSCVSSSVMPSRCAMR